MWRNLCREFLWWLEKKITLSPWVLEKAVLTRLIPFVWLYLWGASAGGQDQRSAHLWSGCFHESGLTDLRSVFIAWLLEHWVQLVWSWINFPGTHTSFRPTKNLKKKHGNKRNTRVRVCVKLTFWRCNCPFCLSCSTSAQWSQRWSAGGRTEWHTQWLLARSDLQTHIHKVNHHYMLKLNVLLIMLLWTFSSEIQRKCILPTSNRERFQLVLKFQWIS